MEHRRPRAAEHFAAGKGAREVAKLLGVRRQSAHGHPTEMWTPPRVARLIEQPTGERYHAGHVWWILR